MRRLAQRKGLQFQGDPQWPREESNLRARIRSPSLYPLSYGAVRSSVAASTAITKRRRGWLMGLEPTTLPREVAPSAHDFPRLAVSPPDVTDSEQREARPGKARPRAATVRGG